MTATVSLDPSTFVVGLYGHLNFHLTDKATGRPITDLQTYLGAFGHTLIMSEDMVSYVHAHPLDILAMPDDDGGPPQFLIPPGADLEKLRGGPDVTFEGLMPKPGRYRAWTQFRRHDKLYTFSFTFTAEGRSAGIVAKSCATVSGPSCPLRPRVRRRICCAALWVCWPREVFSHETLTTTVLFDREIVRVLNKHCVMCHVENGPSFPLVTYEQTWLQGRKIRADVIARHMPPWAAVPGYGQFINDNSVTLRETQFIVSWVEGLGPRNGGTVFTNVADSSAGRPKEVRAHVDFGRWELGEPDLMRQFPATTIDPQPASGVARAVVDVGLTSARLVRALEYMPGDRRVVRAAFFTLQETGQWLGSWTPWYGLISLPAGVAYRLPAGSHIVAEIHYRGAANESPSAGRSDCSSPTRLRRARAHR